MLTAYTRRASSLVCALAPPNGALATIAIQKLIAARIIDLDTARMWHRLFHHNPKLAELGKVTRQTTLACC